MPKEIYIPLIIFIVIALIVLVIIIINKKKINVPLIDVSEYTNNLINLLGGINNLNQVSINQNRLKVLLNDVSLLKKDLIKEQKLIAFLTSNEIQIIIKEYLEEIKNEIEKKIKEV